MEEENNYIKENGSFLEFNNILGDIFKKKFKTIDFSFQYSEFWSRSRIFENAKQLNSFLCEKTPKITHMKNGPLVFDCDISDYDEYRICDCKGKKLICAECWYILRISMKILYYILKVKAGFKFVYFFFSGRRGYHAFVFDYIGLESKKIKEIYENLIPNPLDPYILDNQAEYSLFKDFILLQGSNIGKINSTPGNNPAYIVDIYRNIIKGALYCEGLLEQKNQDDIGYILKVLNFALPKLDLNLKRGEHNIKLPFQKHPETQLYGVYIDPSQFDSFNPFGSNLDYAKYSVKKFKRKIESDFK